MILSKLLCEVPIEANINDRFDVVRTSPSETLTVIIDPGRYRDHVALATEIQQELNHLAWSLPEVIWTVIVDDATGIVTIDCNEAWTPDWNVSAYGTSLRDSLGFTGSETVDGSHSLVGTSCHLGGLYPTEPVESDDRPLSTGTDRWQNDAVQQSGRTGVLATVGGANLIYRRAVTLLLAMTDLEAFSTWLQRAATHSFAFYHDRTQDWPGASSEYREYKLLIEGDAGAGYAPDRVEPTNNIWHRATLQLQQRVAPTP